MKKSKISKNVNLNEKFIIFAGRKSRQKARKLAKQNPSQIFGVFSKNGMLQYSTVYHEASNQWKCYCYHVNYYIPDYNTSWSGFQDLNKWKFKIVSKTIF